MQSKKIAIVGNGRYGKFFKNFFETRGCEARVSDIGTNPSTEDIVAWADVVIVAVTLPKTIVVIELISPLLRENQLLMDIASVKSGPVRAMRKSKANVLGTHPFTAPPKSGTFKGQTIFTFYARVDEDWKIWCDAFLAETEAYVVEINPDLHDLERAVDQVLEHMCTMVKTSVMRRLGLHPSHMFRIASPVYRMTSAQMARMFAQSPELYGGIPVLNTYTPKTLGLFREEFERYAKMVGGGSMDEFAKEFLANKEYLGKTVIDDSFALSEALVKTMVNMSQVA